MKKIAIVSALFLVAACDDKKTPDPSAAAPSASAAPVATSATPAPEPSAAPSASASAQAEPASTKDPVVTVRDPKKEPEKKVSAKLGGTVTLYLPSWAGTTWKVTQSPKPLGKAKTETIPGFAGPTTPAAGFTWTLNAPMLKAGQPLKVTLENKSSVDKAAPPTTFTLTIDPVKD